MYNEINQIKIAGATYHKEAFAGNNTPAFAEESPFLRELYLFLKEWFSESPTLRVHTSGSTGTPKERVVRKEQMLQSAKLTCEFFGLKENDSVLLCLPLTYIAGKMIVVRALYAGLDLFPVEPSGNPLAGANRPFDFAAMIPLQAYNALRQQKERQRLAQIRYLIIGGGAIDDALEKELAGFPNAIYSTYGMTETLSHIALRRISGTEADAFYTPLRNVALTLSEDNTLVVDAPLVSDEKLTTNDIADLRPDKRFRILGRTDNTINTGGIKVQIEEVEQALRPYLSGHFAVTSVPHPQLGEAIILLTEQPASEPLRQTIRKHLPRYHQPLRICRVPSIPQTGNGKTDRAATKKLATQNFSGGIL